MAIHTPVQWFIDWWAGLPPFLRLGIPTVFLIIGAVLVLADVLGLGVWLLILGVLLLAFGGRTEAEKKGYHF